MSKAKIYEVRCEVDGSVYHFGARRTREEAEVHLATESARGKEADAANAHNWGKHSVPQSRRYWIEEVDATDLFEIPPHPTPRGRYSTRVERTSHPHESPSVHVEILDGARVVANYDRNYSMLGTFERRDDRFGYVKLATHPKLEGREASARTKRPPMSRRRTGESQGPTQELDD